MITFNYKEGPEQVDFADMQCGDLKLVEESARSLKTMNFMGFCLFLFLFWPFGALSKTGETGKARTPKNSVPKSLVRQKERAYYMATISKIKRTGS